MRFAFVLDPLDSLKAYKDSSVAMMRAAQAAGHAVWAIQQPAIHWSNVHGVCAEAVQLEMLDDDTDWAVELVRHVTPLRDFAGIVMRKDPPFDLEYVTTTWLLERAEAEGAKVFNRPRALRDHSEKFSLTEFAHFAAPTLVAREAGLINAFIDTQRDTVLKSMLDLFDSGRLDFASSCSLSLSEQEGFPRFLANMDKYFDKITLRPLSIANHPEPIRRLGVIAMNTPVEIDIYCHANSTLVGGTRMINGIGGSGDFLRNGFLKIMHTPSSRPTKSDPTGISCVVPHCSHIDHTEHDLDCVVTEQGLADCRGLAPKDRAKLIIEKCAHPEYKPILSEYLEIATADCLMRKVGHEPQLWDRAFKMQLNLSQNGTMKINNWDINIDLCE